ncbi:MAG: ATP synthase subunit b [Microgenomates group bacterium GW2011_GWB1_40_9]|nr:MAG: ATP synthase subunit b [Microgenomates group bacterium GW2011_GWC1_39_12]KKR79950.1 MAG: ATP synthase subunit b [Microgenomates group bacterium GW2011_GWB1_40_9]
MDKLGIEPSLFIAQLINFTIIMVLLNWLMYKPILGMLEKRKKKIQEGLELTEKMRLEWEKMDEKKAKLMEEARIDALKLIEEAKKQAKSEEHVVLEETRKKSDDMIEKAKREIAELKLSMDKQVRREAVALAVEMTKRILGNVMSKELQHTIVRKQMKDLESI